MPDRDEYPAGVPCWVEITRIDPPAALGFYEGIFGWERGVRPAGAGSDGYVAASLRGRAVAGIAPGTPERPGWTTYVAVDDIDAALARAVAAGGRVVREPQHAPGVAHSALVADVEGAVVGLWQADGAPGSLIVNEHGTVNFNVLHTADPAAAGAFYGALFGWEADGDGPTAGFWRLPGYGDHIEAIRPGTRRTMEEMGAPPGFIDVVAAVEPAAGGEAPRWTVTFGVDDAEAAAAAASGLGGSVVAPPFDAPWVRATVLADPEGAELQASQFVPPERPEAPPG